MAFSESDTRLKIIDPKIKESEWNEYLELQREIYR